jgi:hypothetical protein
MSLILIFQSKTVLLLHVVILSLRNTFRFQSFGCIAAEFLALLLSAICIALMYQLVAIAASLSAAVGWAGRTHQAANEISSAVLVG